MITLLSYTVSFIKAEISLSIQFLPSNDKAEITCLKQTNKQKLATKVGMSLDPALRRDFCEFEAILVYTVTSKTARAT